MLCDRRLTTGVLVAAVGTVLVSITLPDGWDAATVSTLKLAVLTFCLSTYRGRQTQRGYEEN